MSFFRTFFPQRFPGCSTFVARDVSYLGGLRAFHWFTGSLEVCFSGNLSLSLCNDASRNVTFKRQRFLTAVRRLVYWGPAGGRRINRQTRTHKSEPTNAERRSSRVILISPKPKST